MKGDQLAASLIALVAMVSWFVIGWRQWTGRDRDWYEHPLPFGAFMNDFLGPSPLPRMILAAGLSGIVVGLLIAQVIRGLGFAIIVIGGLTIWAAIFLMLVRPKWVKPSWMKEVDQARGKMQRG